MTATLLAIDGVRKRYGKDEALRGVSFDVARGELFGLLGPNGAGKTTLLSILAGLTAADAGTVTLNGQPFDPSDRALRSLVGLATQDLALYPELSARENIQFFGKLYGLRGEELNRRTDELLRLVGLAERATHRVSTYSGGMKRRLNLAVALVHDPILLLLDEPTTGVDPQSRKLIFELVKERNAAGLTVLYTSHYMEEVQSLCPRIGILDHGAIVALDSREHLLDRTETEIAVDVPMASDDLLARLRTLPGVASASRSDHRVTLMARNVAPLLPKILAICGEVTAIDLRPPTLERVFLELTGHQLRD